MNRVRRVVVCAALLLTAVPTGAAAAPPDGACAWASAAGELLRELPAQPAAPAARVRAALVALGFGVDGTPPVGCGETADSAEPLHGTATKGIFAAVPARAGTTIPVSAGGDIGAALARPGDVVEIAAGEYPPFTPRSGADGAYVTYRSAPGAKVVITGGIELDGSSFVHLDGLTVRNAASFGIHADHADHVALTRVEVDGSGDGGMVFLGSHDIHVEGCDIHGTNAKGTSAEHEALSLAEGTTRFEVFNCTVHDNGEEGIDAKYDSTDGAVHHNLVWGNRGPNIYVDAATHIVISHNYAWGATSADKPGIMLAVESYSKTGRISDVAVVANTVWDNGAGNVLCWVESGGEFSNVIVRGNTLIGPQVEQCGSGVTIADNVTGTIPTIASGLLDGGGRMRGSGAVAGSGNDQSPNEEER